MKWLLVVIVMNSPIKTDLAYDSLQACLSAENQMRKSWSEVFNESVKSGASKDTQKFMQSQMPRGTCIPTK